MRRSRQSSFNFFKFTKKFRMFMINVNCQQWMQLMITYMKHIGN